MNGHLSKEAIVLKNKKELLIKRTSHLLITI